MKILNVTEDLELLSLASVSTTQFAAGTKAGYIYVWDNNFNLISTQNIGLTCNELIYYEPQTEIGPVGFLICGVSPLQPTGQGYGIFVIGSGYSQALYV